MSANAPKTREGRARVTCSSGASGRFRSRRRRHRSARRLHRRGSDAGRRGATVARAEPAPVRQAGLTTAARPRAHALPGEPRRASARSWTRCARRRGSGALIQRQERLRAVVGANPAQPTGVVRLLVRRRVAHARLAHPLQNAKPLPGASLLGATHALVHLRAARDGPGAVGQLLGTGVARHARREVEEGEQQRAAHAFSMPDDSVHFQTGDPSTPSGPTRSSCYTTPSA